MGRFFATIIIDVDYIIDVMHSPVYQSNSGLYLYWMAQWGKVDMPNSITALNGTPIFEWYVVLVWLQEQTPKRRVLKELDRVLKI